MDQRLSRPTRLAFALAMGMTLAVAGCALVPRPTPVAPCAWLKADTSPTAAENRLAILVDVSNSSRSSVAETDAPDYVAALRDIVQRAAQNGDRVSIAAFSGTRDIEWVATDLSTRPRSDNHHNQTEQQHQATECIRTDLSMAASRAPAVPGTDSLSAIRDTAGWVRTASGAKRIVVATDGLVNAGCADLTGARFAEDMEVDSIVRVCGDRKELPPDLLSGVDFTMVGVGRPAPDHPAPTPAQVDWLKRLWERLCAGAGGDRCHISTAPVVPSGTEAENGVLASPDVADPEVSFGGTRTYRVPSAALFGTNESTPRPEATTLLARIAVDIRTTPAVRVVVEGHTDSRGSADDNLRLSAARATAVMALLTRNGVPRVSAVGMGESRLVCRREFPDGQPDAACLERNRRVDIIATSSTNG